MRIEGGVLVGSVKLRDFRFLVGVFGCWGFIDREEGNLSFELLG